MRCSYRSSMTIGSIIIFAAGGGVFTALLIAYGFVSKYSKAIDTKITEAQASKVLQTESSIRMYELGELVRTRITGGFIPNPAQASERGLLIDYIAMMSCSGSLKRNLKNGELSRAPA
jgi:hypothetical protein